jgi:hypothetical protein
LRLYASFSALLSLPLPVDPSGLRASSFWKLRMGGYTWDPRGPRGTLQSVLLAGRGRRGTGQGWRLRLETGARETSELGKRQDSKELRMSRFKPG